MVRILTVIFLQVGRHASNELEQLRSIINFLFSFVIEMYEIFFSSQIFYRKTARATVALLPLLGITHYLSYAEPSIDGPLWYFIFYCLVSYFLTSFHGTFISLMYFLLTEEVIFQMRNIHNDTQLIKFFETLNNILEMSIHVFKDLSLQFSIMLSVRL